MEQVLIDFTCDILRGHPGVMELALRQRAKFEGWLKFELAATAVANGATDLLLESGYASGRADLSFQFNEATCFIEMKAPNTNYRMPGVLNLYRPIKTNKISISDDARKLAACDAVGMILFVMFPIRQDTKAWVQHVRHIEELANIRIVIERNCRQITLPIEGSGCCDVVVCCVEVWRPTPPN